MRSTNAQNRRSTIEAVVIEELRAFSKLEVASASAVGAPAAS
jgi:hypothetical protein